MHAHISCLFSLHAFLSLSLPLMKNEPHRAWLSVSPHSLVPCLITHTLTHVPMIQMIADRCNAGPKTTLASSGGWSEMKDEKGGNHGIAGIHAGERANARNKRKGRRTREPFSALQGQHGSLLLSRQAVVT
jgi:hypothetical protein